MGLLVWSLLSIGENCLLLFNLMESPAHGGVHFQVCLLSPPGSCYLHLDLSASLLTAHRPLPSISQSLRSQTAAHQHRVNAFNTHPLTSTRRNHSSGAQSSPTTGVFSSTPSLTSHGKPRSMKIQSSPRTAHSSPFYLGCIIRVYELHSQ